MTFEEDADRITNEIVDRLFALRGGTYRIQFMTGNMYNETGAGGLNREALSLWLRAELTDLLTTTPQPEGDGTFSIRFHPASENPSSESDGEPFLVFNPCDGYHEAFARFDGEEFEGFAPFAGDFFSADFYTAWAQLPDTRKLGTLFPRIEKEETYLGTTWRDFNNLNSKPLWGMHDWPQIFNDGEGHWFGVRAGWSLKDHISDEWKGRQANRRREDGEFLCYGAHPDWENSLEQRPTSPAEGVE